MKNIFSKIITTFSILGALVIGLSFSSHASAWTTNGWNQSSAGCPTFVVANVTTGEGVNSNGCWTAKSISAKVGDVINLTIYFHNETGYVVNDVAVRTQDIRNATGTVVTGGSVIANGTVVASEQATINLPANAKLTYVKSAKGYQSDGYNYAAGDLGATNSVFTGLQVGPLQSTWADQGNVKIKFVVEGTTPATCTNGATNPPTCNICPTGQSMVGGVCTVVTDNTTAPSANTNAASVSSSNVTLSGNYTSGGLPTDTWFEVFYGGICSPNNYLGSTPVVNRTSTSGSATHLLPVGSLNGPGTYSYYISAENTKDQRDGNCVSFIIPEPAVTSCTNGATNPPSCNVCPAGQSLVNNICTTVAQSCTNGALNSSYPSCNVCPAGLNYVNGYCSAPSVGASTVTTFAPNVYASSGSATLNGSYVANTTGRIGFEIWRNAGGYNNTFIKSSVGVGSSSYSYDVSGLADGTYTYRAYFISDNGATEARGESREFTISRAVVSQSCNNGAVNSSYPSCNVCLSGYVYSNGSCIANQISNNYTAPTAQTLNPVSIDAYNTTLGGYYTTGSCAGSTWFEYGPTQALGSRTSSIARAANSAGNTSQTIYGLSGNTTYYYRVVSQNCQNTVNASEIRSFTTTRPTIIDNITKVITPRIVNKTVTTTTVAKTAAVSTAKTTVVGGTGVKYLRLNIDNDRKEISRGDTVTYDVEWENISNEVTLNDLVLEVSMPKELQITGSSRGDVDRSANAVYLNIDRLDPREEGRMTVTTRMTGSLRDGDPLTGRAIAAFENPTLQGAQENAIAYDADHYRANGSVLGASAFGAGFLPGTLAGWLIIFLIIVLIILAARHYMRSGYYAADDRDHHNDGPYTPYRPQA